VTTAFVTGGSGFVGKRLIAALVAGGADEVALARSDGAERAVTTAGARPVRGDLGDRAAMQAGMAGCAVVYHAAAHVAEHGKLADFVRGTVDGTANALAAARAAGVLRFVHVGTEAVLADGKPIVNADETIPLAAHPPAPTRSRTSSRARCSRPSAAGPARSTSSPMARPSTSGTS